MEAEFYFIVLLGAEEGKLSITMGQAKYSAL